MKYIDKTNLLKLILKDFKKSLDKISRDDKPLMRSQRRLIIIQELQELLKAIDILESYLKEVHKLDT